MISVNIGAPHAHEGLTLFPLFPAAYDDTGSAASWTLLADALGAGSLEVTEVDEDGVVGELIALNHGPTPVLILDGEQLIGAKQNRTTSRSILVAPSARTAIPVSCMEQGRWRHTSASMRHGGEHSPSRVRRHARQVEVREAEVRQAEVRQAEVREAEVTRSEGPAAHRRRRASPSELLSMAQGPVWDSVAESSHRAGVRSHTGALDEVYTARRESLEERAARFPSKPGQVGLLAFLHGAPVGLDLLPGQGVYARVHDRLVRAYLFESLDAAAARGGDAAGPAVSREAERGDAEAFLTAATEAARRPMETVGLGTYSAVAGEDIFGAELALDGDVVHLSAFNGIE